MTSLSCRAALLALAALCASAAAAQDYQRSSGDVGMVLLADTLVGDTAAQWKDADEVEALAGKAKPGQSSLPQYAVELNQFLAGRSRDPGRIVRSVELTLGMNRRDQQFEV